MKAVDLFAGAGGFSEGARAAGIETVWAGNHWPLAVECHRANHPAAAHATQDLQQADWRQVPAHDVILASPACQGHSPARGKERPHHDAMRSTAWAVVSCAEVHRTPLVVVENVPAFSKWVLYRAWCAAWHDMGYAVSPHVIDAADHGVPQNRVRLFLVISRSKAPIELRLPRRDHVSIGSVIDWDDSTWGPVNKPGRSAATLARIAAGRAEHGERFVAAYYSATRRGRSIDRPIGTITTHDRWAVVSGDRMRMLSVREARAAMGFPASYHLPERHADAMTMLGNAVVPAVATDVLNALRTAA